MNLEPDSITANTYVAALAGAILGLRAFPGDSFLGRLSNLLFGFLLAVFVGPAAIDYFHITSMRLAAGLVFVIGAAGLVVFAAVLDGVKQTKFGDIISSWLSRNRCT
jgi:hypothetical protein